MAAARASSTARGHAHGASRQASPRRPELTVHQRAETVRRVRPIVMVSMLVFVAITFGAVGLQIRMVQRQQRLDSVRSEINRIQEENKSLRQHESMLQSTSEILRIAETELGMVQARPSEIVTPATVVVGTAGGEG
ncbi:MAG: cell division protein FtsL [Microthrixaceae bacterium]|nr:cell division protein FtsL [Microthrixaceae bacterium]MCO5312599.1 cell division protein FtsL [Microthrixaceae bacterium]